MDEIIAQTIEIMQSLKVKEFVFSIQINDKKARSKGYFPHLIVYFKLHTKHRAGWVDSVQVLDHASCGLESGQHKK